MPLDDDFDVDNGYHGMVQFALAVRNPLVADITGANGFEMDNDAIGSTRTPKTSPIFSNVTIVGPYGQPVSPLFRRAAHLRRNSEPCITNSLLIGNWPVGVLLDGQTTIQNAQNGLLNINNTFVCGATTPVSGTPAIIDAQAWLLNAGGNAIYADPNAAGLVNPFNPDSLDFRLTPNSIALRPAAGYAGRGQHCAAGVQPPVQGGNTGRKPAALRFRPHRPARQQHKRACFAWLYQIPHSAKVRTANRLFYRQFCRHFLRLQRVGAQRIAARVILLPGGRRRCCFERRKDFV